MRKIFYALCVMVLVSLPSFTWAAVLDLDYTFTTELTWEETYPSIENLIKPSQARGSLNFDASLQENQHTEIVDEVGTGIRGYGNKHLEDNTGTYTVTLNIADPNNTGERITLSLSFAISLVDRTLIFSGLDMDSKSGIYLRADFDTEEWNKDYVDEDYSNFTLPPQGEIKGKILFEVGVLYGDVRLTEPTPTPEPATLLLMGVGLASIGFVARRRQKQA